MRARWAGVCATAGVGLLLASCSTSQGLLDEGDFSAVAESHQGELVNPPGWTWCTGLSVGGWVRGTPPSTELSFDDGSSAAATIVDRASDEVPSARVLRDLDEAAALCEQRQATAGGNTIEPLTDLPAGALGWRTRTAGGTWGEYVVLPLDDWRLLAVGFDTGADEGPVDISDLVVRAVEGAERFPADAG